jgi:hypothetical protein
MNQKGSLLTRRSEEKAPVGRKLIKLISFVIHHLHRSVAFGVTE